MADNTTLNAGTGGDVIATDDLTTLNGGAVSGFKVQRVKAGFGVDGSLTDVSATNPMPIVQSTPSTIYSAQQTVTATAVALTAQALVNGLVLKAKSTNVGPVYVGPSGVTTGNGFALQPGEAISYGVANASAVFIIGTASDVVYVTGN